MEKVGNRADSDGPEEPEDHEIGSGISQGVFSGASTGGLLDTRTSQLDDVLNEKLEQAFHKQTSQVVLHDLVKIALEHDPIDLAHAVTRLPPSARPALYDNLPDLNAKIIFLIHTSSNTRVVIFRHVEDREITRLFERMPPDEVVSMLDEMSDRRMKRVLEILDPKKASRIRELQKHDRHSAGRLMTNEFFAFRMNTTIKEVAAHVRNNPGIDFTRRIFVLNDEDELVGFVPARNLIVNSPDLPIRQVMRPILQKITPDASRDEAVDLMDRYNIPGLPVVDEDDHLLGVIAYEDAVEAMKDIADETIANIAGTAEDVGDDDSLLQRFFWRAPWLLVTLCAGFVNAAGISYFRDRPWFMFVPSFVHLITGMSGNVGIQCSTIIVRLISAGDLSSGGRRNAIGKELTIGMFIGLVFGLICGCAVYGFHEFGILQSAADPMTIGLIVSFGVLGACLTATFLGAFAPFVFAAFRIDPAVASGPIVTAFNDVLATLMYFLIASVISNYLA